MKATSSIRAVFFDFDGTLAKLNIDFPLMRQAVLDLITAYGAPLSGMSELYVLEMIKAAQELISEIHPKKEEAFLEQAVALITKIEIEAAKKGELIAGTRDMLAELKRRNIKAGVVTRNCQAAVTAVFPDIFHYCGTVITREMTRNVKPHPEHLLVALRSLGAVPESSSMVGDHPMDIKIGKEAGTLTIGVLTGYSTSDELSKAGADFIIGKAADIIGVLP
ncbi:MAG TPA: HAD hydrolase-like protein [Syntrophales bacterium]